MTESMNFILKLLGEVSEKKGNTNVTAIVKNLF